MSKVKEKKSTVKKVTKVFKILAIISIISFVCLYAINFAIGDEEEVLNADGTEVVVKGKKQMINALICGVNENLTDTIMFIRYNVETGKIAMMSIPRDTYVDNDYSIGHKINAIYRGKNIIPLVEEVQELLDVKIDYYLVFDTKMVHELVDAVGGVEIDVPMRMKYDDGTQDLHIDLQPGLQVLNGNQAEQFVRFRHNNDYSIQYKRGDLGRTEAQQKFMKAFISTVLKPENLLKAPEIINIAIKNTQTNVTAREATKYITDAAKLDVNGIYTVTAPGSTPYINNISYFKMNEEEARRIIKDEFNGEILTKPPTEDSTSKN